MTPTPEQGMELCTVRIGGCMYGVEIHRVCEILGPSALRPIPLCPEFIAGLVHYRGEILTAIHLGGILRLGKPAEESSIMVMDAHVPFGLLVDEVCEVVAVTAAQYEPVPCTLGPLCKQIFAGAYKTETGLIVQLDPAELEPAKLELLYGIQPGDHLQQMNSTNAGQNNSGAMICAL